MTGVGYSEQAKADIISIFKEVKSIMGVATRRGTPNSRSSIKRVVDQWLKTPEGLEWVRNDALAVRATLAPLPPTSPSEPAPRAALGLFDPSPKVVEPPVGPGNWKRTYLLTSEQNNTQLHEEWWHNLEALARHDGAEIIIGRFVYRKDAAGQRGQEKQTDKSHETAKAGIIWSDRTEQYAFDGRRQLAPDLVWVGTSNISPTAEMPLSGMDNFTGTKSAIFPHPKHAMESVATGKHAKTKINYTTGASTEANYIQRKAGQKAEFHHVIGALIVEVDTDGEWFVRQINASSDGSFYDMDRFVSHGRVQTGHNIEAVTWGDIHEFHLEDWMKKTCWGENGILDRLRPREQHFHDLLDFNSRSHHDRKDAHEMYKKFVAGKDRVKDELTNIITFLSLAERQWCQSYVIESNHDNAYLRWVKESDHRDDPPNATFLLRSQYESYVQMDAANDDFHLFGWALGHLGYTGQARFLDEDDDHIILPEKGGGIQCAMHGHLGPNGSRGNARAFRKVGSKINVGHMHTATILDGVYVAGVMGNLDQGYNKGMSSWSHSFIITYKSGKRAMITMQGERWRGEDHDLLLVA